MGMTPHSEDREIMRHDCNVYTSNSAMRQGINTPEENGDAHLKSLPDEGATNMMPMQFKGGYWPLPIKEQLESPQRK